MCDFVFFKKIYVSRKRKGKGCKDEVFINKVLDKQINYSLRYMIEYQIIEFCYLNRKMYLLYC